MGIAFEADHVIAAHRLLCRGVASRTRSAVLFEIVQRRLFFRIELCLASWVTKSPFTMPDFLTDHAKCQFAVFANSQAFGHWDVFEFVLFLGRRITPRAGVLLLCFVTGWSIVLQEIRPLCMLRLERCALTPLPWAVNGVFVGLETLFALEMDVSLNFVSVDGYLQKLIGR